MVLIEQHGAERPPTPDLANLRPPNGDVAALNWLDALE